MFILKFKPIFVDIYIERVKAPLLERRDLLWQLRVSIECPE